MNQEIHLSRSLHSVRRRYYVRSLPVSRVGWCGLRVAAERSPEPNQAGDTPKSGGRRCSRNRTRNGIRLVRTRDLLIWFSWGCGQFLELIMASRYRSLSPLRTPLGRRAPASSAAGRERGVSAVAAPALLKLLYLWIHSTTTRARNLWAEIRFTIMPCSAASYIPRETIVDQATGRADRQKLMAA